MSGTARWLSPETSRKTCCGTGRSAPGRHCLPVRRSRPAPRGGSAPRSARASSAGAGSWFRAAPPTPSASASSSPGRRGHRGARAHRRELPGHRTRGAGGLLADILGASEASESALRVRARALGLPTGGPFAVLVVVAPRPRGGDREALEVVASAVRHTRRPALVGPLRPGRIAVVVSCASLDDEPDVVCALAPGLPADRVRAVAASDPAAAFADLPDALHHALQTADVADASPDPAARAVWRPRHLGVRGLVWRLRDDRRLLSYVEEQLGPLLRLPEARRNELLKTLRAYVETDGVVTAFASRIGTSRPAAYARLRRLSELLDRDLDDPPTRLSVYLALLVLDQGSTGRDAALAPGR
ncbi:PucR family transcriptional regulator [Saccharopolyspora spinosporotrichia]